ncbi:MAG: lipopolysaccharide biosynthesis protein [Methylobacter sp.]
MTASPYSTAALKRGVVHFFIGKVASALLTISILFWLVRLLTVAEYGAYVTLQAGMGLALAVTSLGLPWMAARYLPEFRLYANGKQLSHFVWQLIVRILLFAAIGALLLFEPMPWLLSFLELTQQTDVARYYLLVLVLESLRSNIQVCVLEPLLQQGQAQLNLVVRSLTLLVCLGAMWTQGEIHLHHVVLAELAGSLMGAASALYGLGRYLLAHRDLPGKDGWQPPRWAEMWRPARHMYFSYLVTLTYSPPVYVFLIQRFLGVETTALFGFLLNLNDQICRYLPATLLAGLIRPTLIVAYTSEGGMAQLTRNANLLGKLSLFVLMPFLVFSWLAGGELLSQLSAGKFTQAGYYLASLLLMLIPYSQRQILETVAVASGQSYLCSWGSSLGILTLPLAYWLIQSGQGLWSPILAIILSQIIFNVTLNVAMAFNTAYRPDAIGVFKMTAGALVSFMLGSLIEMFWANSFEPSVNGSVGLSENVRDIVYGLLAQHFEVPIHGWLDLSVVAALACGLFLLASFFFKPFRIEERVMLSQLLNNKPRLR